MDWYYHAPGRGRVGPLSADALREHYRDRRIETDTLVWHEGMREWQPLERVADTLDLASVKPDASRPPPLPPGPLPGVGAAVPPSAYGPASTAGARSAPPPRKRMSGCLVALIVGAALFIPVVAILAAIALPAYNDYTIRAKLTSVVDMRAQVIQAQVEAARARLGRCPSSAAEAGVEDSAQLDFGTVDDRCAFSITVQGVKPAVDGKTVIFAAPAAAGGAWDCTGGDLPSRYRRPACRADDAPGAP